MVPQHLAVTDPMHIHFAFALCRDDVVRYFRWTSRSLPAAKRLIRVQRWTILIIWAPGVIMMATRGPVGLGLAVLGVAACAASVYWVPLMLASLRASRSVRGLSEDAEMFGEIKVDYDEDGLSYAYPVDEALTWAWADLDRLESNGNDLYLFHTPTQAVAIPEVAFDDDESRRLFAQDVRSRIKAARMLQVEANVGREPSASIQ